MHINAVTIEVTMLNARDTAWNKRDKNLALTELTFLSRQIIIFILVGVQL